MTEDTRNEDRRGLDPLDGLEEANAAIAPDGSEVLDRAISAAMDDALPDEEFAALRERIAAEPAVAARVRAFHAIDAGLRRLADEELAGVDSAARDEVGFVELQARLRRRSRRVWSRQAAPVIAALAAAAALLLFLQARQAGEGVEPGDTAPMAMAELDGTPNDGIDPAFEELLGGAFGEEWGEEFDEGLDAELDAELSVALGYGDAIDILPDVRVEDFEVVDQLELLDFLAEQNPEGRG